MKTLKTPATITASWDAETKVWVAASNDLPGLFAQADTFEELVDLLPDLVADLLSADGWPGPGLDPVPIEILARHCSLAYPNQ